MELERGQCFCCSGASGYKILVHEKPELCNKLFIHLFGEVIFEEVSFQVSNYVLLTTNSFYRQEKN